MEKCEELRHDAFNLVSDIHLIAIQLNLVALQFEVRLHFGEIEYSGEIERIVNIEVNPEQRLVGHRVQCSVESLVVIVLKCRRCLCPQRLHAVDDVVLVRVNHLFLFRAPLLLLSESDWYRHELAVFVEQFLNLVLFEELFAVVADMQHDVRTSLCFPCFRNLVFRASVASPFDSLCPLFIRQSDDIHFVRYHERGIEAESEVSDYLVGVVLVFVKEIRHAGESNLIDIAVNFLFCHTDAVVADGECASVFVEGYAHFKFSEFSVHFATAVQSLEFLRCIDSV